MTMYWQLLINLTALAETAKRRCLWLILAIASGSAVGQELEPRSYANVPIGQNFLVLGLARSEGQVTPSPNVPVKDVDLTIDAMAIGYLNTFSLFGSAAKFDLQTFRTCYDGSGVVHGTPSSVSRCEWGDTRLRLSWNIIGSPALTLEEYRRAYQPGLIVGVSIQVEAPTGDYNAKQLVNAGTNRWMVRPGFGLSYRWQNWYVDMAFDAKFFQDNDNYLGNRIKQDPIYQAQFHAVRYFPKGPWLAFNSNFYRGGESFQNGEPLLTDLENARLGATLSIPLAPHHSIKLNASRGVITRIGSDFDTVALSYLYRF